MDEIFDLIKQSKNILLTLHPSPDGDAVGANLAMYWALKQLKKKVVLISGDSKLPVNYRHLPGSDRILSQNILNCRLQDYNLLILLDIAGKRQITQLKKIKFPENLKIINIDHHATNRGVGHFDLIDKKSPATCEILFNLLEKWPIKINRKIAVCLLAGIYDDCHFKYELVTSRTYEIAAKLAKINPRFHQYLFEIDNNNSPEKIKFLGIALSKVETFFNNQAAISFVPFEIMDQNRFPKSATENTDVANILKSVINWQIGGTFFEYQQDKIKVGFRTRDARKYDLTKIAKALGGGGHRAAAGANLEMPFDQAKKLVIVQLQRIYFSNC